MTNHSVAMAKAAATKIPAAAFAIIFHCVR